ncbi:hypothetical protein [Pedobacter terrae]|uniref:hypothetical protein n=1 Tax=Pedobacter terrae TaxID=405671 RepID=UPI002FFBF97B
MLYRQMLGYLVFILNHLLFMLFDQKVYSPQAKLISIILGVIVLIIGAVDYQFNYKKARKFNISPSLLISLNILMWISAGSYIFMMINIILLIAFIWWEKQLCKEPKQSIN